MDTNCGQFLDCLQPAQPLALDGNGTSTDSLSVTLLKSYEINQFCEYSINANVTITCGPQTPAPTLAPTDGPNTNISETFDLLGYGLNDSVTFTIPVQSHIDNYRDSLFQVEFNFINGKCHNPMLNFRFEEIDFAQSDTEFIGIYYDSYPNGYVKQCTGTSDINCGSYINCLSNYILPNATSSGADSIMIYLLKSAEINAFCDYSINANVTISCGPPPPTKSPSPAPSYHPTPSPTDPQFAFTKTFNLAQSDTSKPFNDYTINVVSSHDPYVDVIFNVTWHFINGACQNPYLSVKFEEIDFAQDDEYLEIRYPSPNYYDAIGRCDGTLDSNCGSYLQCLKFYDLALMNISSIEDQIEIFIVKSAQVNAFCNNSINANLTISCVSPIITSNITCPPTPICTPSPTMSTTPLPTGKPIVGTTTGSPTKGPTGKPSIDNVSTPPTPAPVTATPTAAPTGPTTKPTGLTYAPTESSAPTTATTGAPTPTPVGCNDASTSDNNNNTSSDKIMDYLPWILLAVSGFFNFLLLIALIQQCRYRKSIQQRQRMGLMDNMQMVTMSSRAGHNAGGDFQEITSDNSVDYIDMTQ